MSDAAHSRVFLFSELLNYQSCCYTKVKKIMNMSFQIVGSGAFKSFKQKKNTLYTILLDT